ncbi:alpha/beta hydrolase [Pedobacter sp. HMWF019]|uniref:DUF932 domain-containing protein n=1 Tax=Pedobacter sp. HMWF019 TaxID=2056856 RepID=UPI000D357374|nr:DUF932 domain-containing protein [Pedobacter sp. HMWF019]PTS95644.1 alpha/beta hydrolase [Pedobacter sp. HMWF019]
MADNIYYNELTGEHSFFSVNVPAWHAKGKVVSEYPTSEEAIVHAGLDYEVIKSPLFTTTTGLISTSTGLEMGEKNLVIPDFYATIKADTDTVFGVVGKDYEVIQNRDAFSFFDSIVGGNGIKYETAGALGKGERIFITAKLPDYIRVGKDDMIEKYLFLTTSHDGSGSITAAFTPVRIVCQNTLNAALGNLSNAIKIRHTSRAKDRLEQAHKVMGITAKISNSIESVFNSWTGVKVTDQEVLRLIQLAMAPNKETIDFLKAGKKEELSAQFTNTCDSIFEYAMKSSTQLLETTKGNLFGVYNAVTGYYQNVKSYKDDDAKVKSILLGGTAQTRTQSAFNLCQKALLSGVASVLS